MLSCPKCNTSAEENLLLRKEIYRLNGLLQDERRKNEEMDVLCL